MMKLFNLSILLIVMILQSSAAHSQSDESEVNPVILLFSVDYLKPHHFGPHVFNQSLSSWTGLRFGVGLRIYEKVEIMFGKDRLHATVTNRRYVAFARMPYKTNRLQVRVPVSKVGGFTYLYPELSFGEMQANLQGDINGRVAEIANNLTFELSDYIRVVGRIAYQRIKFDVKTNEQFESLFSVSHGFILSLGLVISTQSHPEM